MLQEHIERFIMLASLEMPNLIVSTLYQGAELSDESTLLTFSLPQKYSLEDLIDELEDQMELILLYHHIPSEDTIFGHHCCAYSNPHFGTCTKSMLSQMSVAGAIPFTLSCIRHWRSWVLSYVMSWWRQASMGDLFITAKWMNCYEILSDMKTELYHQLVTLIHTTYTWVDVMDASGEEPSVSIQVEAFTLFRAGFVSGCQMV